MAVNEVVPPRPKYGDAAALSGALTQNERIAFAEIPADVYHASEAVSHSMLKKLDASPSKLRWELDHQRPPTPALRVGSAVHTAILEPDLFETLYSVQKKVDRRTKDGKAYVEQWEADNPGKIAISEEEMDTIMRVHARTHDSEWFSQFFRPGVKEASFYAHDPKTRLRVRCRPDNYIVDRRIIVDLKTTDCAQDRVFTHDITKYSYATQAAFYMAVVEWATGEPVEAFVIAAVEKSADCDVNVFYMPKDVLRMAGRQCREWLNMFEYCVRTNTWPGYARKFIEYRPPQWFVERYGRDDVDMEELNGQQQQW